MSYPGRSPRFPDYRSRGPATAPDGRGEVSRGHSSRGNRAKGRIRQPRSSLNHSMDMKRQQGSADQRDLLDEALMAALRHDASGDGGTEPGAPVESQTPTVWDHERALTQHLQCVEQCRKPPWYVTRTPGGVRGGAARRPPTRFRRHHRISPTSQSHVFESPVSSHNTTAPSNKPRPRFGPPTSRFKTNLPTILQTPHETRPVPPEQQLPAPKAEPSR